MRLRLCLSCVSIVRVSLVRFWSVCWRNTCAKKSELPALSCRCGFASKKQGQRLCACCSRLFNVGSAACVFPLHGFCLSLCVVGAASLLIVAMVGVCSAVRSPLGSPLRKEKRRRPASRGLLIFPPGRIASSPPSLFCPCSTRLCRPCSPTNR